jgi:hypothetical protein
MMMNVEQTVERSAGETNFHFAHHKSHITLPELEPWSPLWDAND